VSAAASARTSRATSALTASNTSACGAPFANERRYPTQRRLLLREAGQLLAGVTVRDGGPHQFGELGESILDVIG
jgi:hypothetical protein